MSLKQIFRNKTNGRKVLRAMITSRQEGEKFRDETLLELLTYHPEAEEKGVLHPSDVEYLVVRPHAMYKTPTLYFKSKQNTDEDDISGKNCVFNLFNGYKPPNERWKLTRAFRGAIFDGARQQFLFDNAVRMDDGKYVGVCANCKNNGGAVDHYPTPFVQLMNEFLDKNTVDVEYNGHDWEVDDPVKKKEWVDYHDSKASFRILCQHCNSKFGTYNYKP